MCVYIFISRQNLIYLPIEGFRLLEYFVDPYFPWLRVLTEDVDLFKVVDVFEYEGRTEDALLLFLDSMLEQESFLLTFVGLTHSA